MTGELESMGVLMNHPQGPLADVNINLQQNPEPLRPAQPDAGHRLIGTGGSANPFTENKDFNTDPSSGLPIA